MSFLHDSDETDVEETVRVMLHRLATDVRVDPLAWSDLMDRRDAVVVPMRARSATIDNRDLRIRRRHRPRASFAAVAVMIAVVGGTLFVGRHSADAPSSEPITAVSPGDAAFDAGAAPAVWTSAIDDPVAATAAYLQALGIPTGGSAPPTMTLRERDLSTAIVDWSATGGADATGGTVYLRSSSSQAAEQDWTIVGAAAKGTTLRDVRYDGANLAFTVARTSTGGGQVAVAAWIDGQPVSLGRRAVPAVGADGVPLGEVVDLGSGAGAKTTLELPAAADDIVTLRVVELVEGQVRSVTQMAMALPDADPGAVTGAIGFADAPDVGIPTIGGGSGSVDPQDGTTLPPSTTLPLLPDGTLPTVPTLPILDLPTIPTGPTIPVPTTQAGSLADILP